MSWSRQRHEAERWLRTAEEDLRAAEALRDAASHPQACFYAQQSGEKALEALWHLIDADPWGHSVQRLMMDFPQRTDLPDPDLWTDKGALLDKFYVPTRYPNGLPDLTPGQVYRPDDAARGIDAARWVVCSCRKWMEAGTGDTGE